MKRTRKPRQKPIALRKKLLQRQRRAGLLHLLLTELHRLQRNRLLRFTLLLLLPRRRRWSHHLLRLDPLWHPQGQVLLWPLHLRQDLWPQLPQRLQHRPFLLRRLQNLRQL